MKNKITKIFLVLSLFITGSFLYSCVFFQSNEDKIYDLFNELFSILENKDDDKLIKMFALGKRQEDEDFKKSKNEIFNYYQGHLQSYKQRGTNENRDKNGKFTATWFNLSCDAITDVDEYRIAICWCNEYSTNKDYIGIWSLYILRKDDDVNKEYSYWGDGNWTPGINIGLVHNKID